MDILLSWLIKSVVVTGILYFYYYFVLRNKQFHVYNRFYLLVSVILGLVGPFINFKWFEIRTPGNVALTYLLQSPERLPVAAYLKADGIIISGIMMVGIGLLVMLFSKIVWVFTVKASGNITRMHGFNFIETTARQAPFSFLNNLFWKKGMLTSDSSGEKILNHELAHIRQGHTYDKLFCQLACCTAWMNPFYWLIQKELNVIHEFLADQKCINQGDAASFAMMLLHAHNNGSYLNPSHSFFNSSVKRRLLMITATTNGRYSFLRRLLAFPVALSLMIFLFVRVTAQADPKQHFGTVILDKISSQKKENGTPGPDDSILQVKPGGIQSNAVPGRPVLTIMPYKAGEQDPYGEKINRNKGNSNINYNNLLQKQHAEKLAAEKAARK